MRESEEVTMFLIIKLPYPWPLSHEGENDDKKRVS